MSAKSTAILSSPSCFCYRAPTSRYRGRPVQHLATSPSTVSELLCIHIGQNSNCRVSRMHSRKQSSHCPAWRLDSSHPTDAVAKCRSPVQRRGMHHKSGYTRREQGQDCPVRGFGSLDQTGQVQGYASPEECHWGSSEHDTLWCVFCLFSLREIHCALKIFFCWCRRNGFRLTDLP